MDKKGNIINTTVLWILTFFIITGTGIFLYLNPAWSLGDLSENMLPFYEIPLISALIYIFFLWYFRCHYHKWRAIPAEKLPGCTVIVPAFNEGRHVAETLKSILDADYPAGKIQIIAVNDGSSDDTLQWIKQIAKDADGKIEVIDFAQNRGKKEALCAGFRMAAHDFIVTVDSDSILEKNALQKIMYPFRYRKIGAVAGSIYGKRGRNNFFCRMMDVALVFGCDFLRSAQSSEGIVFCTPGALSAYRKQAVLPILEEWNQQQFLGVPSRIGEDRAIATLILREGFHIVHQREAVVETVLPGNYGSLCRMLLRWTRSDFRENILMTRFLFRLKKNEKKRAFLLCIHWFFLNVNMLLPLLFLPGIYWTFFCWPATVPVRLSAILLYSLFWGVFPALIYAQTRPRTEMIWGVIYGGFSAIALSWIGVYSLLTLHNSKWLTR